VKRINGYLLLKQEITMTNSAEVEELIVSDEKKADEETEADANTNKSGKSNSELMAEFFSIGPVSSEEK
jgi:hypothetical protein